MPLFRIENNGQKNVPIYIHETKLVKIPHVLQIHLTYSIEYHGSL